MFRFTQLASVTPYLIRIGSVESSGLMIVALRHQMVSWNLVKIVSGNGLLPDGTKPLPETILSNHLCDLVEFTFWS